MFDYGFPILSGDRLSPHSAFLAYMYPAITPRLERTGSDIGSTRVTIRLNSPNLLLSIFLTFNLIEYRANDILFALPFKVKQIV